MKTLPSDYELLAWVVEVETSEFPASPFDLRQAETVMDVELWLYSLRKDAERVTCDVKVSHLRNVVIDRLRKAHDICNCENTRRLQEMLF